MEQKEGFFRENGSVGSTKPMQTSKDWQMLSSQVKTTEYKEDFEMLVPDEETKESKSVKSNVMIVTFNNGGKYAYLDVPENIWKLSLVTTSIGKFINSSIKGKYEFKKLS